MFLKKSIIAIGLLFLLPPIFSQAPDPDPMRFEQEINAFEKWDRKNSVPVKAILFVGSSSIRMWQTHVAFPDWPVINAKKDALPEAEENRNVKGKLKDLDESPGEGS